MTKEELEKEAEEWLDDERKYIIEDDEGFLINISKKVKEAYLAGAEPREKQIDELKAQIKVLEQNLEDTEICENGLKNRIAELEAQIEKMKTCYFCKHRKTDYDKFPCSKCKFGFPSCVHTKEKDRWEFDKALINEQEIKEI